MWILWKCEFENVNLVKNDVLKLWILSKIRLWNCDFCEKWNFQNVNVWINWGFLAPMCVKIARLVEWHDDKLADVIWELGKAIKVDE